MAMIVDEPAQKSSLDERNPSKQVRIRGMLMRQLGKLAVRNDSSAPEEANRLIREGLALEGLWPPEDHLER